MAIHVLCLTTNGGMPVFARKRGDCDNLPFSTVASLNGIHMFFKSLDMQLLTTESEDTVYIWRDFQDAITIIASGRDIRESVLQMLSEFVFGAIAMFVSREDLQRPGLPERLKKESKKYMPLVEAALEAASEIHLLGYTACLLTAENAQLLQRLNDFSSQCGSLFCCLVIGQRIAVATEGWWDMDIVDRELLLLLLNSSSATQQLDMPVYLPKKSPHIAYRFVSVPVAPNSVVCVLCGTEPQYRDIQAYAQNAYQRSEAVELLGAAERCLLRSLPETFAAEPNVLSLILLKVSVKKCVFARNLQQSTSSKRIIIGDLQCSDILKKFFQQTLDAKQRLATDGSQPAELHEQFWVSDYHKCYALTEDLENVLFLLFVTSVPTFALKVIGQKVLSTLLQDKTFAW